MPKSHVAINHFQKLKNKTKEQTSISVSVKFFEHRLKNLNEKKAFYSLKENTNFVSFQSAQAKIK